MDGLIFRCCCNDVPLKVQSEINKSLSKNNGIDNKQTDIKRTSKEIDQFVNESYGRSSINDASMEQKRNIIEQLETLKCANQIAIESTEDNDQFNQNTMETDRESDRFHLEWRNVADQYESARPEGIKMSLRKGAKDSRSYEIDNLEMELNNMDQVLYADQDGDEVDMERKGYNNEIAKLFASVDNKEEIFTQLLEKEQRLSSYVDHLNEELTKMQLANEDSGEELRKMAKLLDSRDHLLLVCKDELSTQRKHNAELISATEQKDQDLRMKSTEAENWKHKYQEKITELAKLSDQNMRLKESINELERILTGLNQKYEEMTNKKETEIFQLNLDLKASQDKYSNCCDELTQNETYATKLRTMEKESALKLKDLQQEMSIQQLDYEEMESEYNILRSRYHSCQEDLSRRLDELGTLRSEASINQSYADRQVEDLQKEWQKELSALRSRLESKQKENELIKYTLNCAENTINTIERHNIVILDSFTNEVLEPRLINETISEMLKKQRKAFFDYKEEKKRLTIDSSSSSRIDSG